MTLLVDGALLSIRPRFADSIFDGDKTVELRRSSMRLPNGAIVAVYEAAPTMAMRGFFMVEHTEVTTPRLLWPRVSAEALLTKAEYDQYFEGSATAFAIFLRVVGELPEPVSLQELRAIDQSFNPPQSFRYLRSLPYALKQLMSRCYGLALSSEIHHQGGRAVR